MLESRLANQNVPKRRVASRLRDSRSDLITARFFRAARFAKPNLFLKDTVGVQWESGGAVARRDRYSFEKQSDERSGRSAKGAGGPQFPLHLYRTAETRLGYAP